jgi:hypothetical protein
MPAMLAVLAAMCGANAHAAQRTFVALSGVDNGQGSAFAPCRTFAAALTASDFGGEIIVLESGGYGRVTLDKSITITAPQGVYAGISVPSGQNGIDIMTDGIAVVLRGLTIVGKGGDVGST